MSTENTKAVGTENTEEMGTENSADVRRKLKKKDIADRTPMDSDAA